jgi:hypothetical protein
MGSATNQPFLGVDAMLGQMTKDFAFRIKGAVT